MRESDQVVKVDREWLEKAENDLKNAAHTLARESAAHSIFTGLGLVRSGLDMLAVGMGVAAVGYVVGDLVMRLL